VVRLAGWCPQMPMMLYGVGLLPWPAVPKSHLSQHQPQDPSRELEVLTQLGIRRGPKLPHN
jgi:hypothetical protein